MGHEITSSRERSTSSRTSSRTTASRSVARRSMSGCGFVQKGIPLFEEPLRRLPRRRGDPRKHLDSRPMIGLLKSDEMLARRTDGFSQSIVRQLRFLASRANARPDLPERSFLQATFQIDCRAQGVKFLSHVRERVKRNALGNLTCRRHATHRDVGRLPYASAPRTNPVAAYGRPARSSLARQVRNRAGY